LLIGVLTATGVIIKVLGPYSVQKLFKPPVMNLPGAADVAEMRASLTKSDVGFPETPEFVIPQSQVESILKWLRPSKYVPDPPNLP
jgi:hypothetical protein